MRKCLVLWICLICTEAHALNFEQAIVDAAHERTQHTVRYDGAYRTIKYPWGDVPPNTGVCTDVIIRAYRALGTDLQQLVHEDMRQHFNQYPSKKIWGLTRPDKNIDHRRVPNLQTFFTRHGQVLPITQAAKDYQQGHIVTWRLPGNLPHIGIVTDKINPATGNPMIVHNIGNGPELQDMLFHYDITGHYKYKPKNYDKPIEPTAHAEPL